MAQKKHPNFQDLYKLEDIKQKYKPTHNTGYYPITLCAGKHLYAIGNTFRLGCYDLYNTHETIYTLRYYYATQVWNTAIAIASQTLVENPLLNILPHWVDRDDSFRMLVNSKDYSPDLVSKLWSLLEEVANSGNITVCEGYHIENETRGYWGAPEKCHEETDSKFHIQIYLDADSAEQGKIIIENNVWTYKYNKTPKSFAWHEIKDFFHKISLEQRELFNHEWMHRLETKDEELFKSCNNLDIEGVRKAIKDGANVNALTMGGKSPLQCVVQFFGCHGMLMNKQYSEEECSQIHHENFIKVKEIVDCLLDNGADINLFGYDGIPPLVCAYYEHSLDMIRYLLERGANPNVNCYLTEYGSFDGTCSSILGLINEEQPEEYDDVEREIETLVKSYGGRLKVFGWNPEEYALTMRPYLAIIPTKTDIFVDNCYEPCGDANEILLRLSDKETLHIDLSSIKGLKEWHKEVIDDYYNKADKKTPRAWLEWRSWGFELAKQIAKLLPKDVDFYYLRDNDQVFNEDKYGERYWNHSGDRIKIEH